MLEIWFSIGYILLLAIVLFAFVLWRKDSEFIAIAALVVGIAYLGWWEYARPTWTTGTVSGTDRKSTRLNSKSLMRSSYAVFCLKKKRKTRKTTKTNHMKI